MHVIIVGVPKGLAIGSSLYVAGGGGGMAMLLNVTLNNIFVKL